MSLMFISEALRSISKLLTVVEIQYYINEMRVLQISCGYVFSKIYYNLFNAISNNGVSQIVYGPIRKDEYMFNGRFATEKYSTVCPNILRKWYKFTYHYKQYVMFRDLLKRIEVKECDLIHAHTLLTDGGLAYKLKKKYNIPYVVAVRNTDVNGFLDKLPHTWRDARNILQNSERIYFISQGLRNKFEQHRAVKSIIPYIKDKIEVVPNGIDDIFLDNINTERSKNHNIIYVGEFTQNKNVVRLIEAIKCAREESDLADITLTIIGGGGEVVDPAVERSIESNKDFVSYFGKIYDTQVLLTRYREHTMFAMPSIHETFGLVYIEALSQGLPVLYTKGQGVDGTLEQSAGIGVNPLSVEDIKNAIITIMRNQDFSNQTVPFENYRWNNIGKNYVKDYSSIAKA